MKLSMWILADWLNKYQPTVQIEAGTQVLRSVRILTDERTVSEKQHVYVARSIEYFGKGKGVICVHERDIIMLNTEDIDTVFNDILAAFDFYNSWSDQLKERIDMGCKLQDILDESVPLLRNPVFIMDTASIAKAVSKGFGVEKIEPVWSRVENAKSIPLQYLNQIRNELSARRKSVEPYRMDDTVFPFNSLTRNLFAYKRHYGTIVLVEVNQRGNDGHTQIFNELANIVQYWLRVNEDQEELREETDIFLDLLEGRSILTEELEHYMSLRGWRSDDSKLIVKIQTNENGEAVRRALLPNLRNTFPASYILEHGDLAVMIVNTRIRPLDQLSRELRPFLVKSDSYAGTSYEYTDMTKLRQHAKQADIALLYGEKKVGRIYDCKSYAMKYGLNMINEHVSTRIHHPGLDKLEAYDRSKNNELYRTLTQYLINERANTITADVLGIHRNSLAYRIQKIEEIIGEDLNDPDIRVYLIFSILLRAAESDSQKQ